MNIVSGADVPRSGAERVEEAVNRDRRREELRRLDLAPRRRDSAGRKNPWKFEPALWPMAWTSTAAPCASQNDASFRDDARAAARAGDSSATCFMSGPEALACTRRAAASICASMKSKPSRAPRGRRLSAARMTLMSDESRTGFPDEVDRIDAVAHATSRTCFNAHAQPVFSPTGRRGRRRRSAAAAAPPALRPAPSAGA